MIVDTGHKAGTPRPELGRAGAANAVNLICQDLRDHGAGCYGHAGYAEDDEPPEVGWRLARIEILNQIVECQEEVEGKGDAVEQAVCAEVGGNAEGGTGGDGQCIS